MPRTWIQARIRVLFILSGFEKRSHKGNGVGDTMKNKRRIIEMVNTFAQIECMKAFESELISIATQAYDLGRVDAQELIDQAFEDGKKTMIEMIVNDGRIVLDRVDKKTGNKYYQFRISQRRLERIKNEFK